MKLYISTIGVTVITADIAFWVSFWTALRRGSKSRADVAHTGESSFSRLSRRAAEAVSLRTKPRCSGWTSLEPSVSLDNLSLLATFWSVLRHWSNSSPQIVNCCRNYWRFLNALNQMFDAGVAMSDVVAVSKAFLLFLHTIFVMHKHARTRTHAHAHSQLGRAKIYSSPAEPMS